MMISEEVNNTDIGQSLEHCERQRNGRDEVSICFLPCTVKNVTERLLFNCNNEHSNTPNQELLKTHTLIFHFGLVCKIFIMPGSQGTSYLLYE